MNVVRLSLILIMTVAPLLESTPAKAQDGSASSFPPSRDSYDLGLQSGVLLSKGINGIDEVVPGWGFRLSQPLGRGAAEVNTFLGQGHGISYDSLGVDYRLDIPALDELVAIFHLGLHYDFYKGDGEAWGSGFGFHLGGGILQPIAGPVAFRADFQYRAQEHEHEQDF